MNIFQNNLSLPLPTAADDIGAWPEVCLAEIWQPQEHPNSKTTPYGRKLFAAPDWDTLWCAVDKTAVWQPVQRPVAITKYSCRGSRFPLLVKVVNLSLLHPRLFAVDSAYEGPHTHYAAPLLPSVSPLQLQALAGRLSVAWYELQATATGNLRAIGVIAGPKGKIIEQPLCTKDSWIDRAQWQHEGESRYTVAHDQSNPYGSAAQQAFMDKSVVTEAHLASLALNNPQPPTAYINEGIVVKLHNRGRRDPMAPHNRIDLHVSTDRGYKSKLTVFPTLKNS